MAAQQPFQRVLIHPPTPCRHSGQMGITHKNMITPWLRTATAAAHLGRSSRMLLRLIPAGLVRPGTHYMRGIEPNSPITWHIKNLEKRLCELTAIAASTRPASGKPTTNEEQ